MSAIHKATEADRLPDKIPKRATAGDVWAIGQHRLIVGDATDPSVIQLMRQLAGPVSDGDVVIVDPPFQDDLQWESPFPTLQHLVFTNNVYANRDILQFGPPDGIYVWDCVGAVPGKANRRPLMNMKLCLFYGTMGLYDPNGDTWAQTTEAFGGTFEPERAPLSEMFRLQLSAFIGGHPHQKPVDWIRRLIGCLSPGGLVIDPFAGTGTSLVAADQLRRRCVSIEVDTNVADLVLARLSSWIAADPVHL